MRRPNVVAKASAIPQSLIEISGVADLRASRVRCSAQDSGSGLARHEKSIGAAEIELVDPVQQVRHRHDDNAGVSPLLGGGSIAASLKREAAPVATQSPCSSHTILPLCFNLKREAAPVPTKPLSLYGMYNTAFQSQTRSRPSCHHAIIAVWHAEYGVSISNEKPPQLPPRHYRCMACRIRRFNLKREAAPVATEEGATHMREPLPVSISNEKPPQLPLAPFPERTARYQGFNLKREAAPVATPVIAFVSEQSVFVSISNEKPPQLPLSQIFSGRFSLIVSISNEKPPQLPRGNFFHNA